MVTSAVLGNVRLAHQQLDVLVIDDAAYIRTKIIELLEDVSPQLNIITCEAYNDAIEVLRNVQPAVVLLDINLQGYSGIDLLKFTKAYSPSTIVIMVSNMNHPHYKKICTHAGADYFLDKSKDFDRIPVLISALL